jgi:hypothetical protein
MSARRQNPRRDASAKGARQIRNTKIGPWRWEDFDSFLALDAELQPPTQNALLSDLLRLGEKVPTSSAMEWWRGEQARLVDAAWAARRSHPIYKSLQADPNFRAAALVFERRRRAAKGGELSSPSAPFLFLREFVRHVGYSYQFSRGARLSNYGAHADRRRAALRHAQALRDLLDRGVGFRDFFDTENCRTLLKKLCEELPQIKRKDYEGKRRAERWVLKGFASSLLTHCNLSSPAVITHFARMVGLACETKTAQRYCAEAAKRRRELLAAALLSVAAQQGQKAPSI